VDEPYAEQTAKTKIYRFLKCPLCVGVWIGFFIRVGFIYYLDPPFSWWLLADVFLHGCIGGLFSLVVLLILNKLGFDKL